MKHLRLFFVSLFCEIVRSGVLELKGSGSKVNFYDDNGTLEASWSAADIKSLQDQVAAISTKVDALDTKVEDIDAKLIPLGDPANPASDCSILRDSGITTDGIYSYTLSSGIVKLWTDFSSFSPHCFVLIQKMSSSDQKQYQTSSRNVDDLAIAPADNVDITRSSKLSDVDINYIRKDDTITWNIGCRAQSFFKNVGGWNSDHGEHHSCSYNRGYYSAYATPNASPQWKTDNPHNYIACGGWNPSDGWAVLSGIYIADNSHYGAYSGCSSSRSSVSSPYKVATQQDCSWDCDGYVLLEW